MPNDSLTARLIARANEIQEQLEAIPRLRVKDVEQLYAAQGNAATNEILVLELEKVRLELELERARREIERMQQAPKWLQPAGLAVGLLTLIFFMGLVGASVYGKVVPEGGKFPVVIVLALGTALSASFLTGHATMTGQIPFFGDKYPLAVSLGGGFAILILILLVGWKIYL